MESLSWMAALAMLVAAPEPQAKKSEPAKDAVAPTQRAEDRPAHESPYSAFGAPNAKRSLAKKRSGTRLHCKDGTIQTQGQQRGENACDGHGGVKPQ